MDSSNNMAIQLSPPRKPRPKKKIPADPKTVIIDTLFKNKTTKKLLFDMINEHKELIDEYEAKDKAQAASTPVSKVKKTVKYESPSAYLRRRALNPNQRVHLDFNDSCLDNIVKSSKPVQSRNELLRGVLAFVEINGEISQLERAKGLLKSLGGTLANRVGKGVTHVIFKDGSYETYKAAKYFKVFLVSPLWLEVINSSGIRMPESKFPALHAPATSCESICEKLNARRSLSTNSSPRIPSVPHRRTILPSFTMTLDDDALLDDVMGDIIPDSQSTTNHSESSNSLNCSFDPKRSKSALNENPQELNASTQQSRQLINHPFITVTRKSRADFTNYNDVTVELNAKATSKVINDQSKATLANDSPLVSNIRVTRKSSWIKNTELPKSGKPARRLLLSSPVNSNSENENCNKENELNGSEPDTNSQKIPIATPKSISRRRSKSYEAKTDSIKTPAKNARPKIDNLQKLSINSSMKTRNSVSLRTRQSLRLAKNSDIPEDTQTSEIDMEMTRNAGQGYPIMQSNASTSSCKKTGTTEHIDVEITGESESNQLKEDKKSVISEGRNVMQPNVDKQLSTDKTESVNDNRISIETTKRSSTSTVRTSASDELVSYLPKRFSLRPKEQETKNSSGSNNLSLRVSSSQPEATNVSYQNSVSDVGSISNMSLRLSENETDVNLLVIETRKLNKSFDGKVMKQPGSPLISESTHPLNSRLKCLIDNFESIVVTSRQDKISKQGKTLSENNAQIGNTTLAKSKRKLYNPDDYISEEDDDEERRVRNEEHRRIENATTIDLRVTDSLNQLNMETPRTKQRRGLKTPTTPMISAKRNNDDDESFVELTQCINNQQVASPKKTQTQRTQVPTGSVKMQKQYIACTRLNTEVYAQFKKIVYKLGGFIIESKVTSKTTHLVTPDCSLTINLLRALCQGIWIVTLDWLYESDKIGKWDSEEFYELTAFSPLIQQNRLRRQNFGKSFSHDVFIDCGPIYLADVTRPSKSNLHDLILLCKGTIVDDMSEAKYLIGVSPDHTNDSQISVTPLWITDCIVAGRIKKPKNYCILEVIQQKDYKSRKESH